MIRRWPARSRVQCLFAVGARFAAAATQKHLRARRHRPRGPKLSNLLNCSEYQRLRSTVVPRKGLSVQGSSTSKIKYLSPPRMSALYHSDVSKSIGNLDRQRISRNVSPFRPDRHSRIHESRGLGSAVTDRQTILSKALCP